MLIGRVLFTGAVLAMVVAGAAGQERPKPDYDRVFAMDRVHELRITIAPERFREMQADLAGFSRGRGGRAFGPGFAPPPPPLGPLPEGAAFQGPPPGFSAGRGPAFNLPEPITVRVSVHASGRTWTNVRMRYKGNSSLMAATASGTQRVPFRLEFPSSDRAGAGQTFHGFRRLTFSSNFADDSQLRELLATEVLRDRGVPAARAAFYRVSVDAGEGTKYWGLYTMVEDPADGAMLDAQLGGRGANLYKPDGPAANWSRFDPASFEKKTNERAADFRDVMAAIDALHSETTDRRRWRAGIERVFDVDLFLRWLAVNTAIGNWDAYGAMPHNYYLYGDAARGGRLRWIPWDHNMAFGAGPGFGRGFPGRGAPPDVPPPFAPGGGRGRGGPFGRATQDVLHRDVGAEWPLISRLLSDPDYAARYRASLRDAVGGLMAPDAMARRVRTLHELIAPAVESDAAFRDSAASLLGEITRQRERIHAALAESAP